MTDEHTPVALPRHIQAKQLKLIVRMVAGGTPAHEICDAMSLDQAELDFINANPRFQTSVIRAKEDRMSDTISTADLWDQVEQKALQVAVQKIDDTLDPQVAVNLAVAASKAPRRTTANKTPDSFSGMAVQTSVIRTETSQQAVLFNKYSDREKEIVRKAPQHVSDIVGVERVEEFMAKVELPSANMPDMLTVEDEGDA